MKTRRSPFYSIGTIINGQRYTYTALGVFKNVADAVSRCRESKAMVFRTFELYRNGVNYGHSETEVVAQVI